MRRCLVYFACAFIFIAPAIGAAQTIDPHAVFEEYCSRCHTAHGGDFARQEMKRTVGGTLVGRETNAPVAEFLAGHYGRLSGDDISALMEMFEIQTRSGGLYRNKCGACHGPAVRLARSKLAFSPDGRVTGRYSARDISDFLNAHGRLTDEEAELMYGIFAWHLHGRPVNTAQHAHSQRGTRFL